MIGWMAKSLAGHDKNKIYLVIGETEDSVMLVDGECRPLSKPKRKKKKHIQIIKKEADPEVAEKLRAQIPCRDEEIKRAIKLYKQQSCSSNG